MAKTGGFVGKKKGNKVLTAYLAEKTIEDFDRRQMLIKQALDNNQKVNSNSTHATAVTTNSKVTDRRKSANAGLRAGRAVEHANDISSQLLPATNGHSSNLRSGNLARHTVTPPHEAALTDKFNMVG